ncbi:MAG: glycoside hydrolase family 125 protein [Enterococcus sp.]
MRFNVDVNDPQQFTREWFSWANRTYCQLAMQDLALKEQDST